MKIIDSELIILCGGLSTKISRFLPTHAPRILADMGNGVKFLDILLAKFSREGVSKITLSTGFGHDAVDAYLKARPALPSSLPTIRIIRDLELRGSAVAVAKIASKAKGPLLVVNGDTWWSEPILGPMLRQHVQASPICTAGVARAMESQPMGAFVVSPAPFFDFMTKQPLSQIINLDEVFLSGLGEGLRIFYTDFNFFDIGTRAGLERFKGLKDWGGYMEQSSQLRTEFFAAK
jgi:hypothetical protein